MDALSEGVFEGAYSVGALRKEGNFGLGTYDGIDGEMIALDGHFYHARGDGSVKESEDNELASFAAVVRFNSTRNFHIHTMTMAQLNTYIGTLIPCNNYYYAIKICGKFSSVTARAIPKLAKPYLSLAGATEQEVIFTRDGITGTAVVIRSPQYLSNLNVAGDHFHFISEDHLFGGHALDLTVDDATLEFQEVRRNNIYLPSNIAFQQVHLPASTN